ncbi:hypothetical protein Tco_0021853, partial [Tanacetum coccineum]
WEWDADVAACEAQVKRCIKGMFGTKRWCSFLKRSFGKGAVSCESYCSFLLLTANAHGYSSQLLLTTTAHCYSSLLQLTATAYCYCLQLLLTATAYF